MAVIVSFQPVPADLLGLVESLRPQVAGTSVIDNGSSPGLQRKLGKLAAGRFHFLPLPENKGLAAAQNIGISLARRRRASHVLLLDQDSLPAPDMVHHLLAAAAELEAMGFTPAAVGPRYFDPRAGNPPPFIRVAGLRLMRCGCEANRRMVPADYLISSGSLIPMAALDAVGLMREELFIDYIDIEWGLRARRHGYQSFGVPAARMRHSLGEQPIDFFGRKVPLHSPLRHYYHFRNAAYLYRQRLLPLSWKLADGRRLLMRYCFYSLFARPRLKHWRMMTMGIWHGITGRMGRLNTT